MFGFYVILTIVILFMAFMGGVIGYLIGKYFKKEVSYDRKDIKNSS